MYEKQMNLLSTNPKIPLFSHPLGDKVAPFPLRKVPENRTKMKKQLIESCAYNFNRLECVSRDKTQSVNCTIRTSSQLVSGVLGRKIPSRLESFQRAPIPRCRSVTPEKFPIKRLWHADYLVLGLWDFRGSKKAALITIRNVLCTFTYC